MNRKGQALVEFVLVLPIFIMILFSIIDFGTILNKKSSLENISTDIVSLVMNGKEDEIKKMYPNVDVTISNDDKYKKIKITDKVKIMTPGLNLILGKHYEVSTERVIFNEEVK